MKNIIKPKYIFLALIVIIPIQVLIHSGLIIPDPQINLGPFSFRWYSIFIIIACVVIIQFITKVLEKSKKFPGLEIENAIIYAGIPAIIGARLWHVITDFYLYADNIISALYIWQGGLSIFGAVLGGLLGLIVFAKKNKFNVFELLNIVAFALPLAQIIGRYGNLFNRELYGPPLNAFWAIYIPSDWSNRINQFTENIYFHPAYLYEQIGLLMLFLFNLKSKSKNYLAHWFIGYGVVRFITEFFRIEKSFIGPFTFSQFACIFLIIAGIFLLLKNKFNFND